MNGKICILIIVAVFSFYGCTDQNDNSKKPNILWLVSEDNSPLLGCYGDEFATTPRLDKLASEGVLYTHAFANAPVCAPARSTIISGMYANSLGTENMRSGYAIPGSIKFFPYYLRKAGYYCTNNAKEDYNMAKPDSVWDESSHTAHYKNRGEDQPFFAVFNIGVSHESSIHRYDSITDHDPSAVPIPPYHPDTDLIRHDWAQYYDRITDMDSIVGIFLDSLDAQGLADNTIVFYYSDHGGVLARSKRFLYETGTHVPFIVRFPDKFQYMAPSGPGSQAHRIISFVDLAPTMLSLAGIDIPGYMQGHAFLGSQKTTENPEYAFLFRGRMDERYDMMRSVRSQKYRYIRNYMPFRPWGQHLEYLWKAPSARSWEKTYQTGKANETQSRFWQVKPPEELYDVENDPYEVHNLAGDPGYQEILKEMRTSCYNHSLAINDVGFIPEGQYATRFGEKPAYEVLRNGNIPLNRIIETANMATSGSEANIPGIINRLEDNDPAVRYWAATGCIMFGGKVVKAKPTLQNLLSDPSGEVRIAAAEALYYMNEKGKGLTALIKALDHENPRIQLHAINSLQMTGAYPKAAIEKMRHLSEHGKDKYVQRASTYYLETYHENDIE